MKRTIGVLAGLAGLMLVTAVPAVAGPYTAEYVFGDSLSDNGNLAELLGGNFPNPPSYNNSFTNGPVAPALLAGSLGLTLTPSLWLTNFQDVNRLFGANFVPGTNYAVAGATAQFLAAGGNPNINLPQQIAFFGLHNGGVADPNALYVIDIGGNDVRNAAIQSSGTAAIQSGVQTELTAIATLAAEGAKNFLVVNVPNVGVIPEFAGGAMAAAATLYSQQYDALLAAGLAGLLLPSGASLTAFDLYAFNTNLLANAAAYGLTNLTTPCFLNTPFTALTSGACGSTAQNINSFAYWDAIHPTATVQAAWATGFEAAIGVPEPSGAAVLGLGVLAFVGLARRRGGQA